MKNIKKILFLLIIIMIIPVIVMAAQLSFRDSITKTNNYITSEKFKDRNKFLILPNAPYMYTDAGVSTNGNYVNGGLLNKLEYDLSVNKSTNRTYLSTGIEYWTSTEVDSETEYIVENYLKTKSKNSKSNIRVTEVVKSEAKVSGNGTYSNPWVFISTPLVIIRSNSIVYGGIDVANNLYAEKYAELKSGSYVASFNLIPNKGYNYVGHDGCRLERVSGNQYEIKGILGDIDCTANFDARLFQLNLSSDVGYTTNPEPNKIYYKYLQGWYKDNALSNGFTALSKKPENVGYIFDGYSFGNKTVIGADGKLKLGNNDTTFNDTSSNNINLKANWIANTYSLSYNVDGGEQGTNKPITATYGTEFIVDNPTKKITLNFDKEGNNGATINYSGSSVSGSGQSLNYQFDGWTITGMDNVTHYLGEVTNTSTSASGIKATKFKNLRSTSGIVTFKAIYTSPEIKLPTVSYTGYTCKWVSDGADYALGSTYVPDNIGGVTSKTFTLNCVSNQYTIEVKTDGGTVSSTPSTTAIYDQEIIVNNPKKSIKVNFSTGTSGATLDYSNASVSASGQSMDYTFNGWTITGMDTTTHMFDSTTNSNESASGIKATRFKNLRSTTGKVTFTAKYKAPTITLPKITSTGQTCKWKSDEYSYDNGGTYKPVDSGGATERTFTVECLNNKYEITYNMDYGKSGDNSPTSADFNSTFTVNNPTKDVIVTFDATAVGGSINYSGSTVTSSGKRVNYTFSGWTITGMDTTTHTLGTVTSNKTSESGIKATTFKNLRANNSETVRFSAKWNPPTITLPTVTKTGYVCNWKSDEYTYASGGTYKPATTGGTTSRAFTAECPTKNTYTISYALNNGNYGSSHPTSGTYDTNVTVNNPTKSITLNFNAGSSGGTINYTGAGVSASGGTVNYTFNGWNISGMDSITHYFGSTTSTATSSTGRKETTFKNLRSTAGTVTFTATWNSPTIKLPTITKTNNTCKWVSGSTEVGSGANYSASGVTSITFTASCTEIPSYTIAYTLNNGSYGTNHPTKAYLNENITINNPTKNVTLNFSVGSTGATIDYTGADITASGQSKAYTFNGWNISGMDSTTHVYGSNTSTSTSLNGIKETSYKNLRGSAGTVTFVAQWGNITVKLPKVTKANNTCKWISGSNEYASGSNYTSTGNTTITFTASCELNNLYTIAYELNGGTHGANHPNGAALDQTITIDNPTKSVKINLNLGSSGAIIDYSGAGITASGQTKPYTFNGWKITNMDSSTHTYGTRNSRAKTLNNIKETTFKNLRASEGEVLFTANWLNPSAIILPKITKTSGSIPYTCKWVSNSLEVTSGGSYRPRDGETSITFNANCFVDYPILYQPGINFENGQHIKKIVFEIGDIQTGCRAPTNTATCMKGIGYLTQDRSDRIMGYLESTCSTGCYIFHTVSKTKIDGRNAPKILPTNFNIESITGLENIVMDEATSFYNMFYQTSMDSRYDTITISGMENWNTSKVTNMGWVFGSIGYYAKTINLGDLSNWDTSNVTSMDHMFWGIGGTNTKIIIGDISKWNLSSLDNMQSMFGGCSNCNLTITLRRNPSNYSGAFSGAATTPGAKITVNYTKDVTDIDKIIATKSSNSNVVKGRLVN